MYIYIYLHLHAYLYPYLHLHLYEHPYLVLFRRLQKGPPWPEQSLLWLRSRPLQSKPESENASASSHALNLPRSSRAPPLMNAPNTIVRIPVWFKEHSLIQGVWKISVHSGKQVSQGIQSTSQSEYGSFQKSGALRWTPKQSGSSQKHTPKWTSNLWKQPESYDD